MTKLSKEDRELFNSRLDYAKAWQLFVIVWWDIFIPRKSRRLMKCLKDGMNFHAAFKDAK